MEWISIKDKKPENNTIAIVANEKGYMHDIIATYDKNRDVWLFCNDNITNSLTLEVTHYIEIPAPPRLKG